MLDLIIKNGTCFINGSLEKHDISIKDGKIHSIGEIASEAKEIFDAKDLIVLPGCIDTQVHFREPGSTDTEDLHSGSRAAIVGGITALFEMPNTNPPTANKIEFQKKLDLAKNRMYSNYAFYFGATANNAKDLADLKNLEGGVEVVKLFDSWAGSLPGSLVKKYSLDPMKSISKRIKQKHPSIPVIVFPKGVGANYTEFTKEECFDCLALDSNLPLAWAKEKIQKHLPVQGNLDPSFLISGGDMMVEEILSIKEAFSSGGHIFNLGHGITPNAEIKNVELLVETLKK